MQASLLPLQIRRTWKRAHRRMRELGMIAHGLLSTDHPVLAHVIPMRRCNLSCGYCNEYDDSSKPVPTEIIRQRLDRLADLGTSIITISGGEPLLHPELDQIVAHIRRRHMLAGMITNGYLLVADRIKRLNAAGLDHLQISIDNIMPDDVSMKSLKVLDKKLELLAQHAEFHVNINSVVGGGIRSPQDALIIGRRALELGFTSTVGIIHDGDGQLRPLADLERSVYSQMRAMEKASYARVNYFQDNIAHGRVNHWRCRAGARYLYICEEGLVHYARSSAAIQASRWPITPPPISAANTARRKAALRAARWRACIKSPISISGAANKTCNPPPSGIGNRKGWFSFSRSLHSGRCFPLLSSLP
jgi:MoaA/NifB/PqqE/SkfB family radical SAM enzyme